MDTFRDLITRRSRLDMVIADALADPGSLTSARLLEVERDEIDAEITARFGRPGLDIDLRSALTSGRRIEFELRALGATAHGQVAEPTFASTFMGAAVQTAPLLGLSTVINTTKGGSLNASWTVTNITSTGIVAQGATITGADPVFGGSNAAPFSYKDLLVASAELIDDGACDFEQFAVERVAPVQMRALSADLWGGDGSAAPQGLLAGLSTVAAAGAAIVTFDDVAALLNGVPAAYRYGGNCSIILSPGAHIDLLEEQPLHAWHTRTIHGVPFTVDPALADPATTAKSVAAGDFRTAYAVRLLPLRVESDRQGTLNVDQVRIRVVLRADGRRMVTDAARALVHP